jgi:hypothetical protein
LICSPSQRNAFHRQLPEDSTNWLQHLQRLRLKRLLQQLETYALPLLSESGLMSFSCWWWLVPLELFQPRVSSIPKHQRSWELPVTHRLPNSPKMEDPGLARKAESGFGAPAQLPLVLKQQQSLPVELHYELR